MFFVISSIIIVLLIISDQISKLYIVNNFKIFESIPIIERYIHITYVQNPGAAFGILQNKQMFFIITTSIVICMLLIYLFKSNNKSMYLLVSLILIVSGGIGNLIDRVRLSYVVDFIDIRLSNIIPLLKTDWPVFNFADSYIVVGSIILCYYIIFKYDKEVENIEK